MNIRPRSILFVAPVAFASVSWLSQDVIAETFEQAKVTQVVQDVKVMPSGAAARPAAVNETVQKGSAVQTGVQSRSELTFKDQTISRMGENTIFTIGQGSRTIELGSGQFLLYVPKNTGGAKVKMGSVTAAITGTTVMGHVYPSGIVDFVVLEGGACIHLDQFGQSLYAGPGQMVVYDPIARRLENPVDVDIQEQLSSPLVKDFSQLPSYPLIEEEIAIQHGKANDDLARALAASGATIGTATPEQFLAAFDSLMVRADPQVLCALVGRAVRARPDLADRIVVAAITSARPVRGYSKDYKQPIGKEIPCDAVHCIVQAAIAANPAAEREIVNAALAAAPMLPRECIMPCPVQNEFVRPYIISPLTPQVPPVVSPEKPTTTSHGDGD